MKVLHICPGYFGSKLYDKLFAALQKIGILNEVFTLPFNNLTFNGECSYNLKVWEKKFNFLDRLIYFMKQHKIYKRICIEYSPNMFNFIHAHTLFSAGFPAYLLHRKFKHPYIVVIRNTDVNVFFKYMFHLRSLGNTIMKSAQNIIFISPSYQNFVMDKYVLKKNKTSILNKSIVIPNGIDEYFLDNKYTIKRATDVRMIKLIFIGNLDSNKNIETTIKVCKLLQEKGHSVKYTIIGDILDVKYTNIIAKHKFINYYPRCPIENVLSHLRQSDIFLMPSINETFGLVYAEAMSQGMPVIYSRGQGFDCQFDDGTVGYAVDCFDYLEIAKRIIDLYNDYQQFSERCVALVNKFNWSKIAEEYRKIYLQ